MLYLQTPALLQVVHSMDEITNILHSSVLTYQALSIAVQFPSRLSRLTVMPATGSLKIPVTTTRPFLATALGCLTDKGFSPLQAMPPQVQWVGVCGLSPCVSGVGRREKNALMYVVAPSQPNRVSAGFLA
jgi:hypothetical protein